MIKHVWLALGFGAAVFIGVAVAMAGPGITWAPAAPEQLTSAGVASGLTVALLVLFVMVFLGLAIIDAIDMHGARTRIDGLRTLARAGEPVEPSDFVGAMGRGALEPSAKSYAFTLRREPHGEGQFIGADPSDVFSAAHLIGDRLYLTAFRCLPTVLVLVSAAALAFGLRGLLADYSHGADAATLAADGQTVLIGCAFPLFGAVVIGAVVPLVAALRRRQLAGLIGRIGLLFHGADEQFYVRRLLEAHSDGAADLRRSLSVALGEIRKLFESLRRRVEDHPVPSGGSAGSFERSLRAGLTDLSKAVTRLSEDQDKAVARLVKQCLTSFNAGFGRAMAGQMEGLQTLLKSTEGAVVGLERSFANAARAAQESGARYDASSAGIELKLEQVAERLDRVAGALSAAAERRAEPVDGQAAGALTERLDRVVATLSAMAERPAEPVDSQATAALTERLDRVAGALSAIAEWRAVAVDGQPMPALAERLDGLGSALAAQVEEARTASGAIKQLYASVDSLCLSVAPVLNRLVDTQEDLLAALSGENTTSRLLADVAEDLRQLSRTNRETVERHVLVAGELVKVGQVLEGMASAAQGRPEPGQAAPNVSDGLMRALRDLKHEAEEAARSLPSLEDVA